MFNRGTQTINYIYEYLYKGGKITHSLDTGEVANLIIVTPTSFIFTDEMYITINKKTNEIFASYEFGWKEEQ